MSTSDSADNSLIDGGTHDVLVIGGGVSGLMAATFTARAGLDTIVVNDGESILRRNAHVENLPGFPAGVNPRLFADMLQAQATGNGADHVSGTVTELTGSLKEGFTAMVETEHATSKLNADRVIISSWSDVSYLSSLPVDIRDAGSKQYIETDALGRSTVDGIYAAGRLTEKYHQAVIAAGDGAETAITLIHDSETPFYNDWVAPEGYFTDRGRDVPPGCEEISATEKRARERASMAAMQEYFEEPHSDRQRTHPSLVDDPLGRVPTDE
ncbi:FAD-dependent oxidoreductase [Natronocalculus amylovorans]|uniref:FAD-binding protein n=1 Tax=Natronocalculus amylovorans TaxID=2917812 RepID=A0AAE3FZW8_9EURY|nr:FAD-dependent oxidoreductase [Natronocalculus amylovorans]MCL9818416.1 FAD-binding protein [Natronocalculus amylovorans]